MQTLVKQPKKAAALPNGRRGGQSSSQNGAQSNGQRKALQAGSDAIEETLRKAAAAAGTDSDGFRKLPKHEQNAYLAQARGDNVALASGRQLDDSVRVIPIELIDRSPFNRTHFNPEKSKELIESIREHGVIQAGLARPSPVKAGRFELVAGERRWNACRCVGAATMPLKIRELSDEQVIELQGVENMHREDLNALDEAVKYQQLIEVYGRRGIKTTEAVAMVHAKLKVSEATIFARMRLLKLPGEVKEAVYGGVLPGSHADLIAKLEHNREVQLEVAGEVLNPGRNAETDGKVLSVRETARLVNAGLEKIKKLAEFNTLRDEFTKKGNLVLSASDNKKLFTHTHNPTLVRSEQFVDGTDSGSETDWVEWKKAMGKHAPDPVLAQGLNGEAVIVYPKRAAIEAAKKNAPRKEKSVNLRSAQEKAERCQRKRANDARAAALERLLPRIEAPHSVPPRALWELMAHAVAGDAHADQERAMCSRRKLDVPKINGYADKGKAIAAHLKTLKTEREFQAFTIELLIGGGCYFDPKVLSKAEALFELQTGGVKKRK